MDHIVLFLAATLLPASLTTEDKPVGAMAAAMVHVEPHVAVNPGDTEHWVIATIVTDPAQQEWRCAVITTMDSGRQWRRTDLDVDRCIDPWVSFAADGRVLVTTTEIQSGYEGDDRYALVAFLSSDGGLTWSERSELGRTFEHAMTFERQGEITLVARTTDLSTGHRRVGVFAINDALDDMRLVAQLDPFATGYAMPLGAASPDANWGIAFSSQDPYRVGFFRLRGDESEGDRFEGVREITAVCGEGSGTFGGYPALAAGVEDNLYFACAGPEYRGYWLSVSRDGGQSWDTSRRVDGVVESHVRTPMIAANDEGRVMMAWYDRRDDPASQCQHVYSAWSLDGGKSVSEPIRLSEALSCPNAPGNGRAGASSWNSGGDYGALTAMPDGRFLLVWADSRSGRFQLRYVTTGSERVAPAAR